VRGPRRSHLARIAAAGLLLAWPYGPPRSSALPAPAAGAPVEAAGPVILITVDGVRPEEIFRGADPRLAGGGAGPLLPLLRARVARGGFLAGDGDRDDAFPVRNLAACSLPGYQSILSGRDLGCLDNTCGRIGVETVLERARRELGLDQGQVAAFASWPEIALAVEREPGALTVDAGGGPPGPSAAAQDGDPGAVAIRQEDAGDRPPWGYRRDRYTWALAMRYLERHRPRVLYVGLGDPDEWAHLGDYAAYAASVAALDARLEGLFRRLEGMGAWGAGASVLVTTDHGRGRGDDWTSHGFWHPGSARAWLFASTPATRDAPGRAGRGRYDHHSIRPTVEALLGLAPCQACQPPVAELLPLARDAVALAGDRAQDGAAGGP